MTIHPEFDATNSVRLCDRCEAEQGVAAGADAGDCACAACGNADAPHIYPVLADHDRLRDLLRWALPYCPEVLPSMEGGEYADNYAAAVAALDKEQGPG